jgi:transcriptional regulator ATRX
VGHKTRQWQNYIVEMGNWKAGRDYYRIDGQTSKDARSETIKLFNNKLSSARLLLVSTKAGGIGINLVGANRAVILDVNWNPANDVQALYRIYRLGQTKPVCIHQNLFVTFKKCVHY